MDDPTYVDRRGRTLVVALEDDGLTPVRLTVDEDWAAEHTLDELRDVSEGLADEAVAILEADDG